MEATSTSTKFKDTKRLHNGKIAWNRTCCTLLVLHKQEQNVGVWGWAPWRRPFSALVWWEPWNRRGGLICQKKEKMFLFSFFQNYTVRFRELETPTVGAVGVQTHYQNQWHFHSGFPTKKTRVSMPNMLAGSCSVGVLINDCRLPHSVTYAVPSSSRRMTFFCRNGRDLRPTIKPDKQNIHRLPAEG